MPSANFSTSTRDEFRSESLHMKLPKKKQNSRIFRGFFFFSFLFDCGHFTPGQNLNCTIHLDNLPLIVYQRNKNQQLKYMYTGIPGIFSVNKR